MIEIRLKVIPEGPEDGISRYEIVSQETLHDALYRTLSNVPLGDKNFDELFIVVVNGHVIEKEMWDFVKLTPSDVVLVAPRIKSGDNGGLLRTVLVTVIAAIATVYVGPAVGGGIYGALAAAGTTLLGSMLVYSLIPPAVSNGASGIAGVSDISGSQMYSINGQSNQVKRYLPVPKVYGTHRIFPTVAANPYVEIEADSNGELVQYLYLVYDFGLGPGLVTDLKIGDTPIEDFEDLQFNFVDPNRPVTSEGSWDAQLKKDFEIYRNDVSTENVGAVLDANQNEGGPQAGYEVTRTAAPNPDNYSQEIAINFQNPQGLYSYSSNGQLGSNTIDLAIYFAKVGTEDWKPANDYNHVHYFSESGGFEQFQEKTLDLFPSDPGVALNYFYSLYSLSKYTTFVATEAEINGATLSPTMGARFWGHKEVIGFKEGTPKYVIAKTDPEIVLGRSLKITPGPTSGLPGVQKITTTFLGYVTQIAPTGNPLYSNYILDNSAPFEQNYPVFTNITGTLQSDPPQTINRQDSTVGHVSVNRQIIGRGKISRATTDQAFATFKFRPRETGQFKVKITRLVTTPEFTSQKQSSLTLTSISTRFDKPAIVTTKRHVFLEMKIRATNQLNGVIQNLSGLYSSAVPVWTGSSWVRQLNNNPAWIFADLLTGEVNKRAIPKSKLHTTSLLEWANFCTQVPTPPSNHIFTKPRFECNFILDYDATLQSVAGQVASAAQASLNSIDGKYGVLVDKLKTVPVQIFTPRNSSGFSSTRIYTKKPDAIKVKYIDSGDNYQVSELVVYDDGFTELNAVEIDEITSFACTNSEQAWRYGRYVLAQNRLRQETITISVDFEYLVCSRGDYVQVTQDVMKVGGKPARVKSISGNQIVIDDGLTLGPGSYGYVFRSNTGSIQQGTLSIVGIDTFNLTGPLPAKGNLIIIGLVGSIVYDCIVKSITPGENLTASLVLIEKADAIYNAESLNSFPVYDPQLNKIFDPDSTAPGPVQNLAIHSNSWRCNGADYQYYIEIDWDAPTDSAYEIFNVYVDKGTGFNLAVTTRESFYEYIVDDTALGVPHSFKVLAVASNGNKLELASVTSVSATPVVKKTRPSDIEELSTDITGEVLQLVWGRISDCDIDEYLIRYSPNLNASWASSVPLARIGRNSNLFATQARTGIYLIKAVDWNGNESLNPAIAITTVPELFNLNILETITDFPGLTGGFDRTQKIGSELFLGIAVPGGVLTQEYYSEGYYYYHDLLDLGDIFTVRLQSKIQAEGYTLEDIMSNWVTLNSVNFMSNARTSEWDVETQYRTTDVLNVMANWTSMASVNPISGGSDDVYTPWRKIIAGDATGRIFQFRLKLTSQKTSVTPKVVDGNIVADMPDRVDSYNNIAAPNTGYALSYTPPFKGPGTTPNVQITMENGVAGDYWVFNSKTLNGFNITFYNSSNVAVARTFDAVVKGYGRKANNII